MNQHRLDLNAQCIDHEIAWFRRALDLRLKRHANDESATAELIDSFQPPRLPQDSAPYADVIKRFDMSPVERLVLILSFIPHIKPEALDPFLIRNQSLDRRFTEFGGLCGLSHGGFLPTGETAMFLLAGDDLRARLRYHNLFRKDHYLFEQGILQFHHQHPEEPRLSSALQLSPEYRERLTVGESYVPPFSPEFPAEQIFTLLAWDDLVLDGSAKQQVDEIVAWTQYKHVLMDDWDLKSRIKPGYRSLFHGPPGTGKTMTACLLGKTTGLPVFRIDLAKVVSKYIGETEKNLANLFDHADRREWILFFDEADSLFGKRTESRNSNDRAANQQISYLLQRIETYSGIAILATNMQSHLDEAFARRFQSMIHFPMPNEEQRLQLWEDNFMNKPFEVAEDVDFAALAHRNELTGGSIMNVLRYTCLKAAAQNRRRINASDVMQGITREMHKEGKFPRQCN